MAKKQCDLDVNLIESKQFKENETNLPNVKTEPIDSLQTNDFMISETVFDSENDLNEATEVKEEMTVYDNCDKTFKSTQDSKIKKEIDEVYLKQECFVNTEDFRNSLNQSVTEAVGVEEERDIKQILKVHFLKVTKEKLSGSQKQLSAQEKSIYTKDKTFSCNECGKRFDYQRSLDLHFRIHSRVKSLKCDICSKSFGHKVMLNRHMLIHTREKCHKCNTCNKAFAKNSHLIKHKFSHSGDKPFGCDQCEKSFAQKSDLTRHKRVHTGEKPFVCDVCSKGFALKSNLIHHRRVHTGVKPFICNLCNKSFTRKPHLKQHKLKLHNRKKTKEQCDVDLTESKQYKENETSLPNVKIEPLDSYENNGYMKSESVFVSENDPNEAGEVKEEIAENDICNKTFQSTLLDSKIKKEIGGDYLKQEWLVQTDKDLDSKLSSRDLGNISNLTSPEGVQIEEEEDIEHFVKGHFLEVVEEKLPESVANNSSRQKQLSDQEKTVYAKEKMFGCNECGKTFDYQSSLDIHFRIHSGVKPWKCDICGKTFSQKVTLNNHLLIHTGEKPYECDTCNKAFNQKSHLIKHKLSHSGTKSFSCDQCEKSFAQKNDLTRHKRVHTGEKPYVCDVCSKGFALKATLIDHKRVHTGERPFTCHFCNKSFTQKSHLNHHKLTQHNRKN